MPKNDAPWRMQTPCAGAYFPTNLRAQAAMEYLVTYGWALLTLILVIGFLFASGAFTSNLFSQPECSFQPDIPCSSYIIYRTTAAGVPVTILEFTITNGLGFPIKLAALNYTVRDLGGYGMRTYSDNSPAPIVYQPGAKIHLGYTFSGDPQPQPRDFKTIFVTLTYINCRQGTPCTSQYTVAGKISSFVEQG